MNEAEIIVTNVHVESGSVFDLSAVFEKEDELGTVGQGACHGGTGGTYDNISCIYDSMYSPIEGGTKAKGLHYLNNIVNQFN